MIGQLSAVPRSGCNWVLTHRGVFACSIHSGALVPRRSTIAGVPGPRRHADDRDAGWFAPVATRRRPIFAATCAASRLARSAFPGGRPPGTPRVAPWALPGLAVGLVPAGGGARRWPCSRWGRGSPLALCWLGAGLDVGAVLAVTSARRWAWARRWGDRMSQLIRRMVFALAENLPFDWRGPHGGKCKESYSVLRNSAMAMASMARPMTATRASER